MRYEISAHRPRAETRGTATEGNAGSGRGCSEVGAGTARPPDGHGRKLGKRKQPFGSGSGHRPPPPACPPTGHRPRKETREAEAAVRKWERAPPARPPDVGHGRKREERKQPFGGGSGHRPPAARLPARRASATEGNAGNGSSRSEVRAGTARPPPVCPPAGHRPRKERREAGEVVRKWERALPARRPSARPPGIGHGRKGGKRERLFGSGSGHCPPPPACPQTER